MQIDGRPIGDVNRPTDRQQRATEWDALERTVFDVLIVGGGVNGACLYHQLCLAGYSVLLLDKGDFGAGTSQASAMMVWGGLLYLRHFHLGTVRLLSRARETMLRELHRLVKPRSFRYVATRPGRRRLVHGALYLYWLLGGCRRHRPRYEPQYAERELLRSEQLDGSLVYEEAQVDPSDARFVLEWLLAHQGPRHVTRNYCGLESAAFDPRTRRWRAQVRDHVVEETHEVHARWVVNAAGVWTDAINRRAGRQSPYKHWLSKGVFLGLRRDPRHQAPLLFETTVRGDAMALIPWGTIALWGPTETTVRDPEDAFVVRPDDVTFLLDELNRRLRRPVAPRDVVSLRCGVRPLVVPRSFDRACYPGHMSRRQRIHVDRELPWISVYGGKLTSCIPLANQLRRRLERLHRPSGPRLRTTEHIVPAPAWTSFPQMPGPVVSPRWSATEEMCWSLEDYLRRRTNIAQWIARGGLGSDEEHLRHVVEAARSIYGGDGPVAEAAVAAYRRKAKRELDDVLAQC